MKQFKNKLTATVMSAVVMMSFVTTNLSADGSVPASVTTPPAPIEGIRDDGSYHDLVHPGVANGGYMVYSLDGVTWFTTLPGATTVGEYTVYYRAVGDSSHCDSPVGTVTARINRPDTTLFINHLYLRALGREADAGAVSSYEAMANAGGTGGDIVRSVFTSSEFLGRNLSDTDFIEVVYQTLLGRESDISGRTAWTNAFANGASRMSMVEEFINSSEFADLCLRYGLSTGGSDSSNITVDSASKVRSFVSRLYRNCLGRRPDTSGYEYWSSQLQNHSISGANCAYGFFFSPEFTNNHYSNQEFVTRLYRVFLGREPDAAGLNNWVTTLNSGVSRQDVFYGFAHSAEFTRICSEYGIVRG